MKYLMKLESFTESNKPKFNVGDYVYCIDNDFFKKDLSKDTKYKIDSYYNKINNNFFYKLYGVSPSFKEDRFISEIEYMAQKYNII